MAMAFGFGGPFRDRRDQLCLYNECQQSNGNGVRESHTDVDVRLAAFVDGVGAGEVEHRCPGLALQRDQRALGLSEREACRPQERGKGPQRSRHLENRSRKKRHRTEEGAEMWNRQSTSWAVGGLGAFERKIWLAKNSAAGQGRARIISRRVPRCLSLRPA